MQEVIFTAPRGVDHATPLDNLYMILHGRFYGKIVYKFSFYFFTLVTVFFTDTFVPIRYFSTLKHICQIKEHAPVHMNEGMSFA